MSQNMSRFEALFRMIFGGLLFYFFVLGGPTWMLSGLYLMFSGSFRFCVLYYYFKRGKL